MISSFRGGVNEIFALQLCYVALVLSYRRFGTTCRFHLPSVKQSILLLDCLILKDGTHVVPKRRLSNYQTQLRNIPGERRFLMEYDVNM